MGKAIDRTGQRFGSLVFLRRTEDPRRWILQCDCGAETEARATHVTTGGIRSCGCLILKSRIDLEGQKFNRLTFLKPNHDDYRRWTVRCDCGTELEVISSNVKRGLTKSCGCLNLEEVSKRNAIKTANALTTEQVAARDAEWRRRNRDMLNAKKKVYREANKERVAEAKRQCYLKKRDTYLARIKANYEADPEQAITRERKKATLKKEATPSWCDLDLVKALYRHARALTKETGVRHHVDHIVPLRHELVCGLHVHNNLRVIPADENWKKHNSFDPDMPDFTPMCHYQSDGLSWD